MRTLKVMEELLKVSLWFNLLEELEVHFLVFPLKLYLENQDRMVFDQHVQKLHITNKSDYPLPFIQE